MIASRDINADKAVLIENLTVKYREIPAIAGISLNVMDKDYLAIIGPNGGGKTTLLKAIIGLVPVSSGKILLYGKKFGESKKIVGYVPQINSLDKKFPITVREVILTGMMNPKFKFFINIRKLIRKKRMNY